MKLDFILVDLYSQLDAVNSYTNGWDKPRVLSWLQRFGRVDGPHDTGYDQEMWAFCSSCGRFTGFYFNEQNQLVIPGRKKMISREALWLDAGGVSLD